MCQLNEVAGSHDQPIGQYLTGDMQAKPALDLAAKETEDFLKGHGYYK